MRKAIVVLQLFIPITVFSQVENIRQYLQDDGQSVATDIVFTDIIDILQSNIMVIWDHRFGERFSVQTGLGYVPYKLYKPVFPPLTKKQPLYPGINNGLSWMIKPSLLFNGFHSFHIGLPIKQQIHFGQLKATKIAAVVGYKWVFERNYVVEVETGYGVRIDKCLDNESYFYDDGITEDMGFNFDARFILPLSVKLGYLF